MKKFVAFLTLPVIFFLYFFAAKLYVAEYFFTAYALVLTSLVSLVLWTQNAGELFQKKAAVVLPAVPRAYLSNKKVA